MAATSKKNKKEKVLFPTKYDMICEVTRLEELMPLYSEWLKKFGLIIRNKIWSISDEYMLAFILHTINDTLTLFIDILGEHIEFIQLYIEMLVKYEKKYSRSNIQKLFNDFLREIEFYKTEISLKEHWDYINPFLKAEYDENDFYGKNLIELLDDMFENIMHVCQKSFFVEKSSLGTLLRGRRGEYYAVKDLYPPSIKVAEDNKILNRWNPPNKRYNYLVIEQDDRENAQETVLRELRSKSYENYTICKFKSHDEKSEKNQMLINLDYQKFSVGDIWLDTETKLNKITQDYIENLINKNNYDLTENVIEDKTRMLATEFAGKYLLSALCSAIFVPLDDDEDNDIIKKERCYKSFHILAEYFEKKEYGGIIYPSTRMRKYGKHGTNVVLFKADSVKAEENSMIIVKGLE